MNKSEIRAEARNILTGKWNKCALIWLIYMALTGVYTGILGSVIPGLDSLITIVVGGPFMLGIVAIFLKVYRGEDFVIDELFYGFREFQRALVAYLLVALYTLLWMLLLIVPGIIAAIGYSQVFFIMSEDKSIPADAAMRQSKEMMMGHKTDYFLLQLSFLGWGLLSILTLGIGLLWLMSYVQTSNTIFYHRIKGLGSNSLTDSATVSAMPQQ